MSTKNIYGKVILSLQLIVSALLIFLLTDIGILNTDGTLIVVGVLSVLWLFALMMQITRSGRKVGWVYSTFIFVLLGIFSFYLFRTNAALLRLIEPSGKDASSAQISVVVKRGSRAESLTDLKGKRFGTQASIDAEHMEEVLESLSQHYDGDMQTLAYQSYMEAAYGLFDGRVDAMLLNEAYRAMLAEEFPRFNEETLVLDSYEYKRETSTADHRGDSALQNLEVSKQPFIVYISGNDGYGAISEAGRSDVNILMAVNPTTRKILLTTTPRDYYVTLPFAPDYKDKLTHAGIYGIETSMSVLEELYDIQISYYARINFSGFQEVVDALGGVDVYSDYAFTANVDGETTTFHEGVNYGVTGAEALRFVRERYAFVEGDFQRGRNQMHMINAVIDKATSPAIIVSYLDLMDSLASAVATNMPKEKMMDLVNFQLEDKPEWDMSSQAAEGWPDSAPCYSSWGYDDAGNLIERSVVIPNEESVAACREKIYALLEGR